MKYFALLLCLLAFQSLSAQTATETPAQTTPVQPTPAQTTHVASSPRSVPAQVAVEDKSLTLQERFLLMKSKSQTYSDYKVIKETVLDGVWKITRDSIATRKALLAKANKTIEEMKAEVSAAKVTLEQKEASMQDVLYASTHISVLGISMGKQAFIAIVGILFVVLVLGLLVVSGRMKLIYTSVKEKSDLLTTISNEFEEYKRKALEKQSKLSRELQNERNKLAEIRR